MTNRVTEPAHPDNVTEPGAIERLLDAEALELLGRVRQACGVRVRHPIDCACWDCIVEQRVEIEAWLRRRAA